MTAKSLDRILASTDSREIRSVLEGVGIEVFQRRPDLASDDARVEDAVLALLRETTRQKCPDIIVLIQPTSPFVRAEHIDAAVDLLASNVGWNSIQTVVPVAHNSHFLNQRTISADGLVEFRFERERSVAFQKQQKPASWIFGNLVAVRVSSLVGGETFFAKPSGSLVVNRVTSLDIDELDDLEIGRAVYDAGLVSND
jgi:CMP-N-acetylneuraminic acid synthetase